MSNIPEPDIMQTAQEKVLIKHQAIKASRYHKQLINSAKKQVAKYCQQAQSEAQAIRQMAYEQGYQDGVRQLMADMLQGIELSQRQYQQALAHSQTQLHTILIELFNDPRMYEIISHHFINLQLDAPQITMHVPPGLMNRLKPILTEIQHITVRSGAEDGIAMETGDEILHFSPTNAAQRMLPKLLPMPLRCKILGARNACYQKIAELANLTGNTDDTSSTSFRPEDISNNVNQSATKQQQ